MHLRFASLILLLTFSLAACSSVPDRYAPWRDRHAYATGGHQPNLGDVPAAPNVSDAKAQMNDTRMQMEKDRMQGYQAIDPSAPPTFDSDLAPPGTVPPAGYNSSIMSNDLPAAAPQSGSMGYQNGANMNYDSNQNNHYTYGSGLPVVPDNIDINMPLSFNGAPTSSDPSVAVDMSVLGGYGGDTSSYSSPVRTASVDMPSSGGITTGAPVAYFAHGSSRLGTKDRAALRELAQQLKQRPQPVMLAGNASARTGIRNTALSRQVNLKMSERRANAVMDELIRQGVSPEQIYVSAYGDSVPNARQDNGYNEAANRRVEVLFDQ